MSDIILKHLDQAKRLQLENNYPGAVSVLCDAISELVDLIPTTFDPDPEKLESKYKPLTLYDLKRQVDDQIAKLDLYDLTRKITPIESAETWYIGDFEIRRRK